MSYTLSLFVLLSVVAFVKPFTLPAADSQDGVTTLNGYGTPKYTILKTTEKYELREYPATNWASISSSQRSDMALFWSLFKYIGGENVEHLKIPMTVPVATKIEPGRYTMNFYLTSSNNPKPINKHISLVSMPSFKAYVRTFSGYMTPTRRDGNLRALMKDLDKDNNSYDPSYYFACGYDQPWKFWSRRNEVWVVAK